MIDTVIVIIMVFVAVPTLIGSIFGMNIDSGVEDMNNWYVYGLVMFNMQLRDVWCTYSILYFLRTFGFCGGFLFIEWVFGLFVLFGCACIYPYLQLLIVIVSYLFLLALSGLLKIWTFGMYVLMSHVVYVFMSHMSRYLCLSLCVSLSFCTCLYVCLFDVFTVINALKQLIKNNWGEGGF